ncbi:hypothetical protein Tgr7_0410 [Thioalkalivibrio sulfidiphilus HL-EbGr7]|uniref:Uncharacterized protein n=1 Tax=Thioalkalivibrio sulfidiphilus (strain HL-EbGR7) TaxID=396588 RepID=B8GUZ7_THISH|nr:hypothetical protein [Thioalkalivibrio sulfidiphilus]ACL71508.1 hypothetical protein Tgr7_0410 [Thioalkalivibrio sulfidiphilus HL-EbGr7]
MTKKLPATETQEPTTDEAAGEAYRMLGLAQMANASRNLFTVSTLKVLAEIKKRKLFKGLSINTPEGNCRQVSSFEDYCRYGLGLSRQKVDEDLANLSALGEEALQAMRGAGLGYRELRQLRQLPEDERGEVIRRAEAAQDKDEVLEILEAVVERSLDTRRQLKDAQHGLMREQHARELAEVEAEQLRERLRKAEARTWPEFTTQVRMDSSALAEKALLCLDDLERLTAKLEDPDLPLDDPERFAHYGAAVMAFWQNLSAVHARAARLAAIAGETFAETIGEEAGNLPMMPEEEAHQFLHLRRLILNEHEAEAHAREAVRMQQGVRKPGRPKGSKNKSRRKGA